MKLSKLFTTLIFLSLWLYQNALCKDSIQSNYNKPILVTDVNEKLEAGFSEDDILYKLTNKPTPPGEQLQNTKGASSLVQVGYLGVESQPRTSNFTYSTLDGAGDIFRATGGSETFRDLLLELPDGHTFSWVRAWGEDSDEDDELTFFVFSTCLPDLSAGSPDSTQLGTFSSSGSAGEWSGSVNVGGVTINNRLCNYWVRTRFDDVGSSLRLYKIRAELSVPVAY